ncbi:Zinc finger, RanBP2-type [Phytophthora cactorum]|nr:Zinc finger, RanBP2-type [Phytophthora cactorum]
MLTESASPLDSGERRAEARHRRREAAAPYSKRAKAEEDEDDVEFFARETGHSRRGSGFFARLASYIPIVNKLVTEEDEEEEAELQPAVDTSIDSIDIQTTQEDVEEERRPRKRLRRTGDPGSDREGDTTNTRASAGETKGADATGRGNARDPRVPRDTRGPVLRDAKENLSTPPRPPNKRGSQENHHNGGVRATAEAAARHGGDHASYSTGDDSSCSGQWPRASVHARLPWPHIVPRLRSWSIANQNHGALIVHDERKRGSDLATKNGVPFGKRPRNHETDPFSSQAPLCVDMQTPLEREAQKPTPSTSMSWAKYHLSIVDDEKKSLENGMEIDSDDVAPPTSTVPRVAFPQPTQKSAPLAFGNATNPRAASSSNGATLFSPPAVSMTPALARVPEQPKFETIGEFKFTLPLRVEAANQVDVDDEDTRVKFGFSPPPSMWEPPVKGSSQKTAAKANGAAPTESAPAALTNGAVNPLARFMQLKPGQWKCPGCSVLNEATSAKCPCCETANPAGATAPKAAAPAPKPAGSISSSGFSFGVPAADAKKDEDKPTAGYIAEGGFSFGAPSTDSKEETEKPAGSISSNCCCSIVLFWRSTGVNFDSGSYLDCYYHGFTFGATSSSSAGNSNKAKRKAPEAEEPKKDSAPSFNFGAHTTEAPKSSAPAFSFGAAPESKQASPKESDRPKKRVAPSSVASDSKPEASNPAFSFGSASKPPQVPAKETTGVTSSTSSFSFGGSSSSTVTDKPKAAAPSFSFGAAPSTEKAAEEKAKDATPGFTFGSSSTTTSTPAPKASTGFGQDATESKAPAFSFGTSASSPPATSAPATSAPASTGFTFGQSSTTPATSSAPAFGAASATSSAPSFGFGTSTALSTGTSTPPVPSAPSSTPAFTFGSSSAQPAASSGFGSSGSTTSSGFGSGSNGGGFGSSSSAGSSTSFGSSASTAPAFSFGASSQAPATSAPAAGQPAFSFGSSAPAPSGFGAAPAASSGFGSSAPSGGFGAPAGASGFRSSSHQAAPAAPAFGSSLPPPTTTFGAPAFGAPAASGFGSGPSSSGFRTPSPTPAFGAAPGAPAFGAAPAPAFGAPSVAPAFGAAPAAGAFGAPPADGGFNMGAAPQHARGRRILKAKTRTRRTS